MEYRTTSALQTQALAEQLTKSGKRIFALSGDLGSGKTTFTQGFAKALGIKDKIISPTFVLIRQHKIPGTPKTLFHVDLYRLESDFHDLGLAEIMDDPQNVVLIEWAEKAGQMIPKDAVKVHFDAVNENTRKITVNL